VDTVYLVQITKFIVRKTTKRSLHVKIINYKQYYINNPLDTCRCYVGLWDFSDSSRWRLSAVV